MSEAQRRVSSIFSVLFILIFTSFAGPAPAHAQALTAGTVSGAVVDPNGAVVPNANVTIENVLMCFLLVKSLLT